VKEKETILVGNDFQALLQSNGKLDYVWSWIVLTTIAWESMKFKGE
jgi:hypothetical protein